MERVAVITGGSSGIGQQAAVQLHRAGCIVYEFSRRENPLEGIHHLTVDVTDEAQVRAAVSRVLDQQGRIDILVTCAGFGISGAAEFTDSADAHAQLEVNLFGTDNAVRAVLPQMRSQKQGRIVCISSVAGIVSIPFQLWYSISKAAINSYVLGLQNEIRPFGISVCAILPGDISTGFTSARRKSPVGDDIYGGRITKSVAVMEHDEQNGLSAEAAGKYIAKYALRKHSHPLVVMGAAYKAVALLVRLLPAAAANWIVGKLYG